MGAENQIGIFFLCMFAGLIGGGIYDVVSAVRGILCLPFKKKKFGVKIVNIVCDILFFLIFAAADILLAVKFGFPSLRVYMFIGNLLGCIIYLKSVHIIVDFFKEMCYNKSVKAIKSRKNAKNSKKKEVYS